MVVMKHPIFICPPQTPVDRSNGKFPFATVFSGGRRGKTLGCQYPGCAFDAVKYKSKLSHVSVSDHTFKKLHSMFVACQEASGFGWDEVCCKVTASDEAWVHFLVNELAIISGTVAVGARSQRIGCQNHIKPKAIEPCSVSSDDENLKNSS
ncbi:hypothetical protein VP01_6434g1 [Puccinia sorghi]|uniref:Myb/SANT-like domain-containing protein n=1 Tax=Puccinia sorghi TaxID=27349 RepID=A0A0L6UFT9_9BASI|nr:hypothetical protein VP01_6434g1 [Puccinia sorghi]